MTLATIAGDVGSGKSGFLAFMGAVAYCFKRSVYSNLHLHYPYRRFRLGDLVDPDSGEIVTDIQNSVVLIDEAYVFAESRRSTSKRNRLFSYLILQSRKRGLEFFLASHSPHQLDRRIRENTDVAYTCSYSGSRAGPMSGKPGDKIAVHRKDLTGGTGSITFLLDAEKTWPLFDSSQIFPIE